MKIRYGILFVSAINHEKTVEIARGEKCDIGDTLSVF